MLVKLPAQRFEDCNLKKPHFDFIDKVMNVSHHMEAGTFCISLFQGLVYIFHLAEDIFVGDNLAQGGTPQAQRISLMSIGEILVPKRGMMVTT